MIVSKSFPIHETAQWLYVHLTSKSRGTLLFLHGGPGWSDAPWAGRICKDLWKDFNTVHWDQRGSNRSFTENSFKFPISIAQMVADAIEVCKTLETEFQIRRPILVGHSWGALLGTLLASQAPELFQSYIGIGQLVANSMGESISLEFCRSQAKLKNRPDLLKELNSMTESFYTQLPTLFREREILFELNGELHQPVGLEEFKNWMNYSPMEYQTDWEKLYQSCDASCEALWPEIIQRNLLREVKRLDLPVTLLQGRHDYCTPSAPVIDWFQKLSCSKKKELIWFENSGHWPHLEENAQFVEAIYRSL